MKEQQRVQGVKHLRFGGAFALTFSWASICAAAAAQQPPSYSGAPVQIHIAAQPLPEALKNLADQTGLQFAYEGKIDSRLISPRISGTLSPEAALIRILQPSGLSHHYINDRTVAIGARSNGERSDSNAQGDASQTGSEPAPTSRSTLISSAASQSVDTRAESPSNDSAVRAGRQEGIQEIVVTAQKRSERLQDVPMSISVLSGAQLDRSSAQGVTEALTQVAGVSAFQHTNQGGGTLVTIRGVSANSPVFGGASPVAYYLDSVPFGFAKFAIAPDASAYDLERVEVLRGPQGTLYGANAQNGVVRVLTHDADLTTFDLKALAAGSATEYGGGNFRGDVAVNVPLVEGKLAARAVVGYQNWSGWLDQPIKNNANDTRLLNTRLKINAQPTDELSIGVSAWLSRQDYGGISAGTVDEKRFTSLPEPISTDYDAFGLKVGYEFPELSLVSNTSHIKYRSTDTLDAVDYLGGPPNDLPDNERYNADVSSEEINLASKISGPWHWTAGASYRDEKDLWTAALFAGDIPYINANIKNGSKSYAFFGELSRRFLEDKFEVTLGGRYFHDDIFSENVLTSQRPTDSFSATTPRFVFTWYPSSAATVYTSYSEGFRSGALNDPGIVPPSLSSVRPDKLKNYELGAKGSNSDRTVEFDSAVYFIDWLDVQQKVDVPVNGIAFPALINAPSASGVGVDLGVKTRPVEGLTLGINFDWNDLHADHDILSGEPPVALFAKGERLNFSPEITAGASASYLFPLGRNGLEGHLSGSYNYTSAQSFRTLVGDTQSIAAGKSMSMVRATFSIRTPQHWEVAVFGDNLTNEKGPLFGDPFLGVHIPDGDVRPRPRTVGVQLDYNFH